jgi:hypothetical protein
VETCSECLPATIRARYTIVETWPEYLPATSRAIKCTLENMRIQKGMAYLVNHHVVKSSLLVLKGRNEICEELGDATDTHTDIPSK